MAGLPRRITKVRDCTLKISREIVCGFVLGFTAILAHYYNGCKEITVWKPLSRSKHGWWEDMEMRRKRFYLVLVGNPLFACFQTPVPYCSSRSWAGVRAETEANCRIIKCGL